MNLDDHHDERENYHHNAENFAHCVYLQVKKSNLQTRTTQPATSVMHKSISKSQRKLNKYACKNSHCAYSDT